MEQRYISEHHINGPSSLYRRKCCPGSMRIEEDLKQRYPDQDFPTEWSAEGTRKHLELARCIREDLESEDPEIQWAAEYIRDRLSLFNFLSDSQTKVENERKVEVLDERFGTVDLWATADMRCLMAELKFGYKAVGTAETNLQITDYALGALLEGYEHVRCLLIQPPLDHFSEVEYEQEDRPRLEGIIRPILEVCGKEGAPLDSGDHCKRCLGLLHGTCPAVANTVQFDKLVPAGRSIDEVLAEMNPKTLTAVYDQAGTAISFLSELRSRVEAGILGGKLTSDKYEKGVGRRGHRYWKNERQTLIELQREIGDTSSIVKLITPAQVEKKYPKMKAVVSKLVDQNPGAAKVVLKREK